MGTKNQHGLDPVEEGVFRSLALEAATYLREFRADRRGLREPELRILQRSSRRDHLILEDADPDRLASAGWGVIVCEGREAQTRERLAPLLDHRREQARSLYRELVVRPGETSLSFRARYGMTPDSIDPSKVPYYLLIAAPPSEISFQFQYELGIQYAVGRLYFDDPSRYVSYARSVVESESGRRSGPEEITIFGVHQDPVTRAVHEDLLERWIATMNLPEPWSLRPLLAGRATKIALEEVLTGADSDAPEPGPERLLVAAAHGLDADPSWPLDQALGHQGALVCQRPAGERSGPGNWFAGADVEPRADLTGLLLLLVVCCGAGTSAELWNRRGIDSRAQVSSLAQALLGNPGGSASALLGQVDRQWTYTFRWPVVDQHARTDAYRRFLEKLLRGETVGMAMEPFRQRTIALSLTAIDSLADETTEAIGKCPELLTGEEFWKAFLDARNQILLGDPAVRLVAGDQGAAHRLR